MPKARKTVEETGDGQIVATAQQSRFHADANDAPDSKEIDIKTLTISIGGKEVIESSNLRIREGVHYVFAGRNGTGKSTLLKAIAQGLIPGIPSNIRVLLLGQTSIESIQEGFEGEDGRTETEETVLEHVLRSNKARERSLKEASVLSEALSTSADGTAAIRVSRKIELDRAERTLHMQQRIAARRSGARGWEARKDLLQVEALVEEKRKLVEESGSDIAADAVEDEMNKAVIMLDELHLSLEALSSSTAETQTRTVLRGLGFSEQAVDGRFEALSDCDVLLLDEPTNFLDLPSIIWLENYLTTKLTTTSLVVVTHDRTFADSVGDQLIILRLNPAKKLDTFNGTLSEYEADRRKQIKRMTRMKDAQDKKIKHMEDEIAGNIVAAKRKGDDKKLKQAASRKKKLDDRMGLEVGANGQRFKRSRDMFGYHLKSRQEIDIPGMDPIVNMSLPSAGPEKMRFPGSLVSFEHVVFKYPGAPRASEPILRDVTFTLHAGERIAILGLNGTGKSTIINLLASASTGSIPTGVTQTNSALIKPLKGQITLHPRLQLSHFSQHAVEQLTTVGMSDPSLTALSYLQSRLPQPQTEQSLRSLLADLGLRGQIVSNTPLANLSGGQKVRLALAECVHDSPDLLVLDEVSMHLDADSVVALAKALSPKRWSGALLVVSHDRYFVRRVVEGWNGKDGTELEDEEEDSESEDDDSNNDGTAGVSRVYRMKKGELIRLNEGMEEYERIVEKSAKKWMM